MKNQQQYEDSLYKQIVEAGTIPVPARQFKAIPKRKFTWDFVWEEQKLLVEVQGGIWLKGDFGHTSGVGYRRDRFKNDLAMCSGWKVLEFTSDMVTYGEALEFIKAYFGVGDLSELEKQFATRTRRNKKK